MSVILKATQTDSNQVKSSQIICEHYVYNSRKSTQTNSNQLKSFMNIMSTKVLTAAQIHSKWLTHSKQLKTTQSDLTQRDSKRFKETHKFLFRGQGLQKDFESCLANIDFTEKDPQ